MNAGQEAKGLDEKDVNPIAVGDSSRMAYFDENIEERWKCTTDRSSLAHNYIVACCV